MHTIPEIEISLADPAPARWGLSQTQLGWARELIRRSVEEVGGVDLFRDELASFAYAHIRREFIDEIDALAQLAEEEFVGVLAANLYYDFVKLYLGCTAFAVNTDDGPLHARNMDWFSHGNCLSEFTTIINFRRGRELVFQSVGWPGAVGVLSAIAPGRFTVTLNAVLSDEPMQMATPVTIMLREACQTARDFAEAVELLSATPITSDCLLLVTGTQRGEMVVIERTPTRHAIRSAEGDYIIVTNDYRMIDCTAVGPSNEIYESACGRFDKARRRLTPTVPEEEN